MANLLGAKMTTTIGLHCDATVQDPRIRAAFGYVPYSGQSFLPAFCDNQRGAEEVRRPYFAMTGSADTTAPEKLTQQAVNLFKGSRYMVSMAGGEHELRPQDAAISSPGWSPTSTRTSMCHSDPGAMARFIKMAQVAGGREDSLQVDVHVPTSFNSAILERPLVEFYNTTLDHYFIAGAQIEVDIILAGGAGPGWVLTNESSKIYLDRTPADRRSTRFAASTEAGGRAQFPFLRGRLGILRGREARGRLGLRGSRLPRGPAARDRQMSPRDARGAPRVQRPLPFQRLQPTLQHQRLDDARDVTAQLVRRGHRLVLFPVERHAATQLCPLFVVRSDYWRPVRPF
jgi:hypothetical protein